VIRPLTIAGNTFREAVRDRVLYLVAAFGLLVLLSGKIIGWVSVGEDIKIVRDIGLTSVSFFGAMIALFVGTGLIQRELGGRTIYTILARPVARWEFVIGKYLGLLGTVVAATAAMALVFVVYLGIMTALAPGDSILGEGPPSAFGWPVFQSLILTGFELMVVTALAVFFSSVSTPILSAVFTFFAYVAGQFASSVSLLSEMARPVDGRGSWIGRVVLEIVYRLMPNLDLMNIRDGATHGYAVSTGQMLWTIVYAAAYAGCVLAVTCAVFERRNLP
jgi:ABC-type transport system involved in multi-copper enzyme maturation permease subunit